MKISFEKRKEIEDNKTNVTSWTLSPSSPVTAILDGGLVRPRGCRHLPSSYFIFPP